MKRLNELGETVYISSDNLKLDAAVKKILAEKPILEWILSYAVEEFRGMRPEEIEPFLGTVSVSEIPLMPGETNSVEKLLKLSEESRIFREGLTTYDIRFFARSPRGGATPAEYRLIINLEAQKTQHPGYDLVTRGIVYCARQISEQLGRNIRQGKYQNVEKVYSIWIVMDCSQKSANTISEARWNYQDLIGEYDYEPRIDIERVVIIRLPKDNEWEKSKNPPTPLHRMLATLLSNNIHPAKKLKTLNDDYKIEVTETLEEEVSNMCNYSSAILEEGISKGEDRAQIATAKRMLHAAKYTINEISEISGVSISEVNKLKKEDSEAVTI